MQAGGAGASREHNLLPWNLKELSMSRSLVLALLLAAPAARVGTAARAARFRRSGRAPGAGGGEHQHDLDCPRPARACRRAPKRIRSSISSGASGRPQPREYESRSLGSGFIITADGYLLTNAHVVEAADEITVRLTDKREFKAKVIGNDRRTDVALLKIDATGLPSVTFGDPSKLRVGEWVVAIGSPFGFENTVTAGIVSAKGRSLPQENFVPFIQTDVAINPGNSGGPLFNLKGEVIGMNSMIFSRTGGFMGVSFAIPIDVAADVAKQLQTSGRVNRGRIGVVIQEVTKELAESFGLPKAAGALVNSVEKGGPAEKAGIQASDVILKFDNKDVDNSSELPRIVAATRPGAKVPVQIWRKGERKDLHDQRRRNARGAHQQAPAEPKAQPARRWASSASR